MSKLRPANAVLSLVSKLPKQPDFLAQKRLLTTSEESTICPHVGLCASVAPSHNAFINGTTASDSKFRATWIEHERGGSVIGGTVPNVENFYQSAQHCFEVAKSSGFLKPSDFLEQDIALEAFELLTTSNFDQISAHALGVSL